VVTGSCHDRTISVSVASAVSLPASNAYGTRPAGAVTLLLVSRWRDNHDSYQIGQGNIEFGAASFREPSFVRGGRQVEVDFAGDPEGVWSDASAALASC
jgi:hypothetical protein